MITVQARQSATFRSAKQRSIPFYRDAEPVYECGPRMHWRLLIHLVWVAMGLCMIQDRDDIDKVGPLKPRAAQLKMAKAMLTQAAGMRKVRQNVPKGRRHGASTWTESVFTLLCKICITREALTVAHSEDQVGKIFGIARLMEYGSRIGANQNNAQMTIRFNSTGSSYSCGSGLANFAGSGSSIHYLHISEYAKFANTSGQDKRALRSMINAMSQTSLDTIVVIESSGEGPEGDWPDRVNAAEESGNDNEFVNVFLPWTDDPANCADPDEVPEDFPDRLGKYERWLIDSQNLSIEQVYWRHRKIKSEYPGDDPGDNVITFGYDWPLRLADLFGVKKGRIYPMLSRETHEREVHLRELSPRAYAIRVIDWGATEENPFAVAFCFVDPDRPAGFTAAKHVKNFWEEGNKYGYKNGKPEDKFNHLMDCLRMLVVTLNLDCYVHLYDEIYFTNFEDAESAYPDLARLVHVRSGWYHPFEDERNSDAWTNLKLYQPGPSAFAFHTGVADRSGNDRIKMFNRWGIPLIPHTKPDESKKTTRDKDTSSEIEDGIALVAALMRGTATNPTGRKPVDQVLESAFKKFEGGEFRRRILTDAEKERLEDALAQMRGGKPFNGPDRNPEPFTQLAPDDLFVV